MVVACVLSCGWPADGHFAIATFPVVWAPTEIRTEFVIACVKQAVRKKRAKSAKATRLTSSKEDQRYVDPIIQIIFNHRIDILHSKENNTQ